MEMVPCIYLNNMLTDKWNIFKKFVKFFTLMIYPVVSLLLFLNNGKMFNNQIIYQDK